MNFLTLILQSALMAPLVEFATSTSGHVEPREGLALGWLGSVVAGLAVVFGTAERTQADYCYGIAKNSSGTVCRSDAPCSWDHDGEPRGWLQIKYYHHNLYGCQERGTSCQC